jgi:hypothetical protein
MLQIKSMLKTLVLSTAILATAVAFSATTSQSPAKPSHEAIKTYLRADLSLKSVLSSDFAAPAQGKLEAATLRTCRCSCGFRCTTNADCGPGGVCAPGITCCASVPRSGETNALFQKNQPNSSSTNPNPEVSNVNCQQE